MLCFKTTVGRLQAITYFISAFVSFFVVVPVGINLRRFQGSCILFAQVVWNQRTIFPYSEPACDFILYMNLACTLLYAFWMGVYSLFVAIPKRFPFAQKHSESLKEIEDQEERYKIHAVNPVFMFINTIIFFMVLSNAVIITVGLQRFCSWTLEGVTDIELNTCADAQNRLPWDEFKIIRGVGVGVNGGAFYTCLGIATIASWVLFLVWLFQWILNFSQSFTMCSCEVAEEKRKPDQAMLIAARRSRMATPIATPGHMTPGRSMDNLDTGPMRPFTFGPPQAQGQYGRQPPPQQQQFPRQPPQQQQYGRQQQPPHQQYPQRQGPPPQPQQRPPQHQPYIHRPPPQQPQQKPMMLQQGYAPPRR